jgi:hypothetical protein
MGCCLMVVCRKSIGAGGRKERGMSSARVPSLAIRWNPLDMHRVSIHADRFQHVPPTQRSERGARKGALHAKKRTNSSRDSGLNDTRRSNPPPAPPLLSHRPALQSHCAYT